MVIALLAGFVVSYILAIPPGPVQMMLFKLTVEGRRRQAFWATVGAGLSNTLFCLAAIYISSELAAPVVALIRDYPVALLWSRLLIVVILIGVGAYFLARAKAAIPTDEDVEGEAPARVNRMGEAAGGFGQGFGIAFANIASPTFIPALVITTGTVYTFLVDRQWATPGTGLKMSIVLGFGAGMTAWLITLQAIVINYMRSFPSRLLPWVRRAAGIVFIGFAGILGVQVVLSYL